MKQTGIFWADFN